MSALEAAMALGGPVLWSGLAVFLRVAAALAAAPGLGERSVPVRVKLVLALALTAAVLPMLGDQPLPPPSLSGFARLLATETIVGLFLGLSLRLFIMAIQTAGSIAAQSTSLAQISGGAFPEPLPAIGQVLALAALTLLMLTGFPVKLVVFLGQSYLLFPLGVFPAPSLIAEIGGQEIARAFALAFQLAAPFALVSLLYNVVLGAINRAMPQLMVAFVGAPLITWGALALLFLVSPVLLSVWAGQVDGFLAVPFGAR